MKNLTSILKIVVPENIYIKDPESSELGKKIIEQSIILIDEIGFENFTFKKLGIKIGSNESSIYRYFESKHKLLLYLTSWYWAWLEYQLVLETFSIQDPQEKLETAIKVVTKDVKIDSNFSHINEILLHRIIINDGLKSFLTKNIEDENRNGNFICYKRLISRIATMILTIEPSYEFSLSLASTVVEGNIYQLFLKQHFPSITDFEKETSPTLFFLNLFSRILGYGTKN